MEIVQLPDSTSFAFAARKRSTAPTAAWNNEESRLNTFYRYLAFAGLIFLFDNNENRRPGCWGPGRPFFECWGPGCGVWGLSTKNPSRKPIQRGLPNPGLHPGLPLCCPYRA